MKDLEKDVHTFLLGSSKDSKEINQQPSYTQIDLEPIKSLNWDKNNVIMWSFFGYSTQKQQMSLG